MGTAALLGIHGVNCRNEVLEIEVTIILLGYAPAIGVPDRLFKFNKANYQIVGLALLGL